MRPTRSIAVPLALLLLLSLGPVALSGPAGAADACTFPMTSVDATGTPVTVDAEPAEVVTLAPSAAQTMWEIGADGKVVGVSHNADYLAGTSSLTTISSFSSGIDTETVVKLDPDLVLAPNIVEDATVEQLRSAGLTVYEFEEATAIEDVYAKTRLTGRLVGACDGANETVSTMKDDVEAVRAAVEGRERPTVFYHMGGGWTAGGDTFIDEIISTAGGENVAASAGITSYAVISPEVLVSRDPQWFVRGSVPVPDESPYADTTAGASDQVIVVNADYLNQPAPRIVRPIETIAEALHPVDVTISSESGVDADLTDSSPTFTPSVTSDGNLTVAVTGLYTNRSARFDLPADEGFNADGPLAVHSVELTLAEPNPSYLLTVGTSDDAPAIDGMRTVARFAVTANGLWPGEVDRVSVRLRLDGGNRSGDVENVTLYRRGSDGWAPVETTAVRHANGTVGLTATAGTIGTFAVVEPASSPGTAPVDGTPPGSSAGADGATPGDGPGDASTDFPTTGPADARDGPSASPASTTVETSGQPGFGVPVLLLALVIAAFRRGRRTG